MGLGIRSPRRQLPGPRKYRATGRTRSRLSRSSNSLNCQPRFPRRPVLRSVKKTDPGTDAKVVLSGSVDEAKVDWATLHNELSRWLPPRGDDFQTTFASKIDKLGQAAAACHPPESFRSTQVGCHMVRRRPRPQRDHSVRRPPHTGSSRPPDRASFQ